MSTKRSKQSRRIVPTIEIGISSSPFLTFRETQDVLRCSKRSLLRYINGYVRAGGDRVPASLSSVKRGRHLLIAKSAIEDFLGRRTRAVAA